MAKNTKWRIARLSLVVVFFVSLAAYSIMPNIVSAAQITSRSLTLQGVGTNGGSQVNVSANHQFAFNIPTSGTLGSIRFQYCTTASGSCTAPTSLDTTSATLGTSTGAAFTSAVSTAANSIYITRTAAAFGGGAVTEQLLGVHNQDNTNCGGTENCTFYVRISTFASTDTTGSAVDTGTVAASTATQIVLTGTMPESLIFCAGSTISTTSGIPDCSTAGTGTVNFNQLFSPTDTATATSQMAASTNAGTGYVITVNGATLTSGSNTIPAIGGTAAASAHGVGQFGLNLKANTTPSVGSDVAPAANGTNYKGEASANYNTADSFAFQTGNTVADSANGGAGATDAQIFTASYIVNVTGSQTAGTYTTTLTYICTPTF